MKSGLCSSVKCLRENLFLEKPSIFQVREEKLVELDASNKLFELSSETSFLRSQKRQVEKP